MCIRDRWWYNILAIAAAAVTAIHLYSFLGLLMFVDVCSMIATQCGLIWLEVIHTRTLFTVMINKDAKNSPKK